MYAPMLGETLYTPEGHVIARSGMLPANLPAHGLTLGPSIPIFSQPRRPEMGREILERLEALKRMEAPGDINQALYDLGAGLNDISAYINRAGITSAVSGWPVRENLEAPARILVPVETPLRNRLPRVPGAGTASAWRQVTSLGGGWGISTTVTTGASSATQTLGSTAGLRPGDVIYFATSAASRIVSSVTNATVVVLTATISTTTAEVVTRLMDQPGGGAGPAQIFFAEAGAPDTIQTAYAAKSAAYKLLGSIGSVTGFAMAAGANFMPQLQTEKANVLKNTMLNEEYALINSQIATTAKPWGNGSTAYGFSGLLELIATANGTPVDQVQTAVGALTTAHIDNQLMRLYYQGAQGQWMLCHGQEILSMVHLAEASGTIIRTTTTLDDPRGVLGFGVTGYMHPVTGQVIPVLADRFMPAGTIIFGSDRLPDGSPTMDVDVLPQVELPQLAPNEMVQGYVAQEIAPAVTAPQVHAFLVSVFATPRLKSALHVGKSSGITAV